MALTKGLVIHLNVPVVLYYRFDRSIASVQRPNDPRCARNDTGDSLGAQSFVDQCGEGKWVPSARYGCVGKSTSRWLPLSVLQARILTPVVLFLLRLILPSPPTRLVYCNLFM